MIWGFLWRVFEWERFFSWNFIQLIPVSEGALQYLSALLFRNNKLFPTSKNYQISLVEYQMTKQKW